MKDIFENEIDNFTNISNPDKLKEIITNINSIKLMNFVHKHWNKRKTIIFNYTT